MISLWKVLDNMNLGIKHLPRRRVSLLVNILGGDFIPLDTPKQKIPVVETDNTQPLVN